MKRFLFYLLILIVIGALGGAYYLRHLVQNLNPRLETALSKALGVPVTIGNSSLDIRHGIGIVLSDVQVAGIDDCLAPVKIKRVSLRADIKKLLSKQFVIHQFLVDGLKVHIEVNQKGNLQLMQKKGVKCAATHTPPSPQPTSDDALHQSIDLQLQVKSLKINDLDAEIRYPKGSLTLNDFQGESELNLGTDTIELVGLKLLCSLQEKALTVSSKQVLFGKSEKSIQYQDVNVEFGSSKAKVTGRFGLVDAALYGQTEISEFTINIDELTKLLITLGVKGLPGPVSGVAKGALKIDLTETTSMQGSLALTSFAFRDGADQYAIQSLKGDLKYNSEKRWKLSSNKMIIVGFGYQDFETTLSDIDAELNKISFVESTNGDINGNLFLNGTKLKLEYADKNQTTKDPEFLIQQIGKAEAPLQIKIPKKGGYEITSTVEAKDVDLVWQYREFQNVSGSIKMLISDSIRRFESNALQFLVGKESASVRTAFEMTPVHYQLGETKLNAFGGNATIAFTLGRNDKRTTSVSAILNELDLAKALPAIFPSQKDALVGTLQRAELSVDASWNDLKGSANGKGSAYVVQGDLKKFDFSRVLGRALDSLPDVTPHAKSQNDENEAPAQSVTLEFQIQPGTVNFTNITLQRTSYSVRGTGTSTFDGEVEAQARVTFLKENLGKIGSGLQAVTGLLGRMGRLDIPIKISGKIPELSIGIDKATFLKEKSGLAAAGSLIEKTGDVIGGVGKVVLNPLTGGSSSSEDAH